MNKISSPSTFFSKKVLPILWFGMLAIGIISSLWAGAATDRPMVIVILVLIGVAMFFRFRKRNWGLADEVFDEGDSLLLRYGGKEDRVALSNIMSVSTSPSMDPPRISLRLVNPCKFGTEIAFSPKIGFLGNPLANNPVAEDLMVRVDRARSHRAP
jgi:hypothetical protein